MAKHSYGRFVVTETEDGRFVAVAATAPYFCFRAETKDAVLDKVKRAVTFCQSQTEKNPEIAVKTLSQKITSVGGETYSVSDLLEAA